MPLTRAQFAEEIKRKFPQYQSVPDNQLVDAMLTKFPQYRGQVHEAPDPEAQKAPLPGGTLRQFLRPQNWSLDAVPETLGRAVGATGSTLNPMNWLRGLAEQARSQPKWETALVPGSLLVNPMINAVGTAADWYQKALRGKIPNAMEQALSVAPEAVGQGAGQALLMRAPIGRLAEMTGKVPVRPPEPGPVLGILSRSKAALDHIEAAYPNAPVNTVPAFKIALRAFEASKRGYTLPKPIADFLDHVKGQQLDFQASRDFSKALGEKIPWDQPGAKVMNGFMKQMREALEEENTTALKNDPRAGPKVADQYLKAKAEYGKGQQFIERMEQTGHLAGGYAGYELGRQLGHPLEGASAGGYFGRRIFRPLTGGIARQVAEPARLGQPIGNTAAAVSAARKAATPFLAPAAPYQPPEEEQ